MVRLVDYIEPYLETLLVVLLDLIDLLLGLGDFELAVGKEVQCLDGFGIFCDQALGLLDLAGVRG